MVRQRIRFSKKSTGKYIATPYEYLLVYDLGKDIRFKTDNPEISIDQIKQSFLDVLEANSETNTSFEIDASDKQLIIEQINAINSKDDFTIKSSTECINTTNGLFVIPQRMEADIVAFGKETGLKYSDFGTVAGEQMIVGRENSREKISYVFAGGYDVKKIDKESLSEKMNFTGKAVGQVMLHTEDAIGVATNDYMSIASNANLTFDNGKETLVMNFSENTNPTNRWYDVKFISESGDTRLELTNGDKISQENVKYKFDNADISKTVNSIAGYIDYANGQLIEGNMHTEYYGDTNIPSEAVGRANYLEQSWDPNSAADKELFFTSTFGAIKQ